MQKEKSLGKGFTMTELIAVIAIIGVLMSLTLVMINHVKKAAYASNTGSSILALSAACENYYQDFKAYPGPADGSLRVGSLQLKSMSENLVLGLSGGLDKNKNFTPRQVGMGPVDLASGKQYRPYLQTSVPRSDTIADHSLIKIAHPVYVDSYPEALPILYYRAAKGVAIDMQYTVGQNSFWTNNALLGPPKYGEHGLKDAKNNTPAVYELQPYLNNPMEPGAPRGKDKFVLIAAGKDRTYGTSDDTTSFGSVIP